MFLRLSLSIPLPFSWSHLGGFFLFLLYFLICREVLEVLASSLALPERHILDQTCGKCLKVMLHKDEDILADYHVCVGIKLLHLSVSRGRKHSWHHSFRASFSASPSPAVGNAVSQRTLTRAPWPGPPSRRRDPAPVCCHENVFLVCPRVRVWTTPEDARIQTQMQLLLSGHASGPSVCTSPCWTPCCGMSGGWQTSLTLPSVTCQGTLRLQINAVLVLL